MAKFTRGIKKACQWSKWLDTYQGVLQLFYNVKANEVFVRHHFSDTSYTRFDDPDIICAGYLYGYTSMKEIRLKVDEALYMRGLYQ